ncbi:MAG: radical SAM family heme chaperone HemW [bacterium]
MASIYIHIPFCKKKCSYCDFYSVADPTLMDTYIDALCKEIDLFRKHNAPKEIDTVYIGGGTPSLLKHNHLESIIAKITTNFNLSDSIEWTIECNPGTVSKSDFEVYLSLGINRLSIGIQSLNDDELKFLGRIHDSKLAEQTIKDAQSAGFKNISCDLMFAIPNQTAKSWQNTLDGILKYDLQHISAYSLIYEDGTPLTSKLNSGKINRKSAAFDYKLYEIGFTKLVAAGYRHYEISNYAKPSFKSKHNMNYWIFGDYYGFGASAHSYYNQNRFANISSIKKYIDLVNSDKLPIETIEVINRAESLMEQIFLSLRATGLDMGTLPKTTVDAEAKIRNYISILIKNGYAIFEDNRLNLTSKGFFLTDEISVKLDSMLD